MLFVGIASKERHYRLTKISTPKFSVRSDGAFSILSMLADRDLSTHSQVRASST